MTKKKAQEETRIAKMVYLPPDVARRLEKAAKADDVSQSNYMVQALKARFKKEGIESTTAS